MVRWSLVHLSRSTRSPKLRTTSSSIEYSAKLCAEEITEVVLKLSMRRKVEIEDLLEVTVGDHNFSLEDGELEIDHPDYGPCACL